MASKCPHCDVVLTSSEARGQACPVCGKSLPTAAETPDSSSATESRTGPASVPVSPRERGKPNQPTPHQAAPSKATGTGYALAIGGVVLGAIVVLALDEGRADWVWLGCGVGAGLGAFVAQITGNWPTGKSRKT